MPRSSSVVVRQGMPTRGLETVFSWGLAGVMEDQIVTFGVKGGNLWKRDPWTVATPAARPRLSGTRQDCGSFFCWTDVDGAEVPPTPGCFCERVRNRLKTKELLFA